MTQLVELQQALPRFEAAGIKLYAVSYDDPEALAEFARHHGISLAARESAEARIDSALGEILRRDEEPSARAGDDDIRISATYHGGRGNLKFGAMR